VSDYTNLITPPDFVEDAKHTVLLLNPKQEEVQELAEWCQQAEQYFNIYIYNETMGRPDWAKTAAGLADAIIDCATGSPLKYFTKLDKLVK